MSRRRRSQLSVIVQGEVFLEGSRIPCVVKRSQVARQVRLEVREGGTLIVVLPRRCSLGDVDDMVRSKSRWILRKTQALASAACLHNNGKLRDGDSIPYLGDHLRIVVRDEEAEGADVGGPAGQVRMSGQTLVVSVGRAGGLEPLVETWYRDRAADMLPRKAREFAASMRLSYGRLSIRGQRTRWGSCSHRGTLSFNWRLIMAPEPVVDYVVVHELAHLREMNHTGRFWMLVADHCPSWREHRRWLNDHGAELSALLSAPE